MSTILLTAKERSLLEALEAACPDEALELVTLEIVGAKKSPIIRVYIDTPDSVSFTELSEAQNWIGETIERIDPFPGAYTLEVSSPGIDRPLRTKEHFERFVGEEVRLRLIEAVEGSRNFRGVLIGIVDDVVSLETDTGLVEIGFANIQRANVIGKVEF